MVTWAWASVIATRVSLTLTASVSHTATAVGRVSDHPPKTGSSVGRQLAICPALATMLSHSVDSARAA